MIIQRSNTEFDTMLARAIYGFDIFVAFDLTAGTQFKVLNSKVFSLPPTDRFAVTLVFSLGIAQTIFPVNGSPIYIY